MSNLQPSAFLLLILATLYGAFAHLLWGQRWRHLLIFWGAAFVGCLLVYGFGVHLIKQAPAPAGVPFVETTIGAWLMLGIASRLRV